MLKVSEIFFSLQGESTHAGRPCIFIRLSGCNLECRYCDTRYALDEGKEMEMHQILTEINQYPCRLVEITGGEPLCQPASIKLMQRLLEQGYQVLLETNGSLRLDAVPKEVARIVDVKLSGSGHSGCFLLENLKLMQSHDEIKFVILDRQDYLEAVDFVKKHILSGGKILFSPVSDTLAPTLLAQWILEDGLDVRFQLQLHKVLGVR